MNLNVYKQNKWTKLKFQNKDFTNQNKALKKSFQSKKGQNSLDAQKWPMSQ